MLTEGNISSFVSLQHVAKRRTKPDHRLADDDVYRGPVPCHVPAVMGGGCSFKHDQRFKDHFDLGIRQRHSGRVQEQRAAEQVHIQMDYQHFIPYFCVFLSACCYLSMKMV